jgi:hypothetical protein
MERIMNRADQQPVPEWKLERYALGELPPDDMERLRRLIESEPTLQHRIATLQESDAEIRHRYPAAWMARQIKRRQVEKSPAHVRTKRLPSWALATACLILAMTVPLFMQDDLTRIKGDEEKGPSLALYRQTEAGSEKLADGGQASASDLIQIAYRAAGGTYGAIFSVDGNGTLTWHLPATGDRAAALEQDTWVLLGFSYELDAAPRWERFFLLSAGEPFEPAALDTALAQASRGATRLELPPELIQTSFTLKKQP